MGILQALNRITMARALLIGGVVTAFYYFLMYDSGASQGASIAAAQTKLQELQTQMNDAQTKLENAAVYKKTAAEVGSTIEKLIGLIPEKFGMSDLMRIVSNEVKTAGSSLAAITPKSTEPSEVAPEFEEVSLDVDVQGSFLQHMVFLSNLTKVQNILIIRKYEMSNAREGKGDEAPSVRLNAEIVAFRYRGKSAANAGVPDAGQPGQLPQGGGP